MLLFNESANPASAIIGLAASPCEEDIFWLERLAQVIDSHARDLGGGAADAGAGERAKNRSIERNRVKAINGRVLGCPAGSH